MLAQGAAGLCAWVVWGWPGGVAWVVRRRLGMGGRGWCCAWVGLGASGGWSTFLPACKDCYAAIPLFNSHLLTLLFFFCKSIEKCECH